MSDPASSPHSPTRSEDGRVVIRNFLVHLPRRSKFTSRRITPSRDRGASETVKNTDRWRCLLVATDVARREHRAKAYPHRGDAHVLGDPMSVQ